MSKEVKRYYTTLAFDRPDIAANCSIQGRPATCTSYELTCVVLASDYDALLEENQRLESAWKVDVLNRKDELIAKQEKENDRVKAERDALLEERDRLQKDAERLDWLMSQDNCVVQEATSGFWLQWIDEHDPQLSRYQSGEYPSGREAIDAALQGEQP